MDQPAASAQPRTAITVEIASKTLFVLLGFVAFIWLGGRLSHFWLLLTFAILVATAIDLPVSHLQRKGVPRPLGILLFYILIIVLVALVALVMLPLIAGEATILQKEVPKYLDEVENLVAKLSPEAAKQISMDAISAKLSSNASTIAEDLTKFTVDTARLGLYTFITLVLAFFLATETHMVPALIQRFLPEDRHEQAMRIASRSRDRIGAWARGQVLIAIIFGVAMGIGLKLIGVPHWISLAVIAGVLEIIPYVGGLITVILAGVVALSLGVPHLIAVIVLYLILVNVESHVLAPLLFGKAVGLPPVAILIALIAGVELLGVAGALLAIPVTVILWVMVEELWPPKTPAAAASMETPAPAPPGTV